jgi:hypothetical protein
MAGTDHSAWLFVQGIPREKWAMSPGPSIAASYKGKQIDEIYVPGILLGFPSVKAAARAAMRFHFDLAQMFGSDLPPMVIDAGGNPRSLATIAHGREAKLVLLTPQAARELAGEPIELAPGPELNLEGMKGAKSHILPPTDQNIGWGLPSVPVEVKGAYPDKETPELALHPASQGTPVSSVRISLWKEVSPLLRALFAIALLGFAAHFFWQQVSPTLPKVVDSAPRPEELPTSSVGIFTPLPFFSTPTPATSGIGSLVVVVHPSDAEVYVNERLAGKRSPVKLENRDSQEIAKLTIRKRGYKTHTRYFNVEADRRMVVEIRLERDPSYAPSRPQRATTSPQ